MAKTKQLSFTLKTQTKDLITNNTGDYSSIPQEYTQSKVTEPIVPVRKKRKLSKRQKRKQFWRRAGVIFLIVILILVVGGYVLVWQPAMRMKDSFEAIKTATSAIFTDVEAKDLRNLESNIDTIQIEFDKITHELTQYEFLTALPFTKGYYDNLEHIQNIIIKSNDLIEESLPEMKEILSKTGFIVDDTLQIPEIPIETEGETDAQTGVDDESGDEEQSASSLILAELPRYLDFYEQIEPQIYEIFEEIEAIDPTYVPVLLGFDLRDNLEELNVFIDEYPELSQKTLAFMRGLPELVGSNGGPTSYLVILQNEAEMRASGGLLTAFGTMQIENGEIAGEISFSDMWNLEIFVSATLGIDTGNRNIYGQRYLMNQGCGSDYLRAQDAGIYPDLYWTSEKFTEYYDIANEFDPFNYPDYDHVIILNHAFAENLLSLIQPLEVEGYGEVTATNLFEFIKEETDNPELAFSPERKAIIQDIANAAKEKFTDLPLTESGNIVRIFVESILAKDLGFYSTDIDMQNFFDAYSMSGRINTNFDGDYFHLNEAQNCSLKLNEFVRNDVVQDIFINGNGSISKEVLVTWEQPQIWNKSLELLYDSDGNFTYRAWVRLFTPVDSTNFDSDGLRASTFLYYDPIEYYDDEMDKEVSDNVIRFDHRRFSEDDPIPGQTLTVSYDLPASINYNADGTYQMLIQKHPGKSWGERYTVNIHHDEQVHTIIFTLDRDKIIRYQNGIISIDNYESSLDWLVDLADRLPVDLL